MRNLIAGLVLAIVFLGLLFAAPRYLPSGIEGATRSEVAQIGSGFTGTKYIGPWTLACGTASGVRQGNATATNPSVGRCRMARGYRDQYGQLVLAIAFRYAEPGKQLTMVVRFPPVGSKGQFLTLVLPSKMSLRLPVFGCTKAACVAVGALIPAAKSMLVASPLAAVVLPANTNGKQFTIRIRLDGLEPALAGLERAEF